MSEFQFQQIKLGNGEDNRVISKAHCNTSDRETTAGAYQCRQSRCTIRQLNEGETA
jgi:hypothetical protein